MNGEIDPEKSGNVITGKAPARLLVGENFLLVRNDTIQSSDSEFPYTARIVFGPHVEFEFPARTLKEADQIGEQLLTSLESIHPRGVNHGNRPTFVGGAIRPTIAAISISDGQNDIALMSRELPRQSVDNNFQGPPDVFFVMVKPGGRT